MNVYVDIIFLTYFGIIEYLLTFEPYCQAYDYQIVNKYSGLCGVIKDLRYHRT
jgi:hypothetical protein